MVKILFSFLILSFQIFAKDIITLYLESAQENIKIKNLKEQKEFYENSSYKKSYIDKVEIEGEYYDLRPRDAKYSIKIYPKSKRSVEIEDEIFKLKRDFSDISYQESFEEELKFRYYIILDAYFYKRLYDTLERILRINNQKIKIATRVYEDNFEALSKISYQRKKLKLKAMEYKRVYQKSIRNIKRTLDIDKQETKEAFEKDWILKYDEISDFVKKYKKDLHYDPSSAFIQNSLYKAKLSKQKAILEELDNKLKLNRISFEYDKTKKREKAFSLSLQIEIPFFKEGSLKTLENRARYIDLKNKTAVKEEEINNQIISIIDDIIFLSKYISKIESFLLKDTFYKTYSKVPGANPLLLLSLKEQNLNFLKDKLLAQYDLYKNYIELLYLTNLLAK